MVVETFIGRSWADPVVWNDVMTITVIMVVVTTFMLLLPRILTWKTDYVAAGDFIVIQNVVALTSTPASMYTTGFTSWSVSSADCRIKLV